MNLTSWGLLFCIGVVAFILLQAVRRVERQLAEAVKSQQHAISRIADLEKEVKGLRSRLRSSES